MGCIPSHPLRNQCGSTYLVVMFAVVVMSIGVTAAAKQWKTVMQREKEADLLIRGIEIQEAIRFYWQRQVLAGLVKGGYPLTLEELTKGPRPLLRKVYKDPITGEDWEYIREAETGRIKGVRSRAKVTAIKQHQFPPAVAHFEGLTRYNDWVFQHQSAPTPQTPQPPPGQGVPPPGPAVPPPSTEVPPSPPPGSTQPEGKFPP